MLAVFRSSQLEEEAMMTIKERLRMHLVQALTRCENTDARAHLQAALQYCDALTPTSVMECPVCGKLGLPERIQNHQCREER